MSKTITFKMREAKDGPEVEHTLTFLRAAIRFRDRELGVTLESCGRRHYEIIKDIHDEGYTEDYLAWHVDGFMYMIDDDPSPMFMDRDTATEVAKAAGIPMIASNCLTSEDLW